VTGDLRRRIVVAAEGVLPVFRPERVDMNGAIRGLRRDVLIQWIPSDALDVVAVLRDLSHQTS
jgi:hypothetical protein